MYIQISHLADRLRMLAEVGDTKELNFTISNKTGCGEIKFLENAISVTGKGRNSINYHFEVISYDYEMIVNVISAITGLDSRDILDLKKV